MLRLARGRASHDLPDELSFHRPAVCEYPEQAYRISLASSQLQKLESPKHDAVTTKFATSARIQDSPAHCDPVTSFPLYAFVYHKLALNVSLSAPSLSFHQRCRRRLCEAFA